MIKNLIGKLIDKATGKKSDGPRKRLGKRVTEIAVVFKRAPHLPAR